MCKAISSETSTKESIELPSDSCTSYSNIVSTHAFGNRKGSYRNLGMKRHCGGFLSRGRKTQLLPARYLMRIRCCEREGCPGRPSCLILRRRIRTYLQGPSLQAFP